MAADTVIGLLRVLLSANTAEFDSAMKGSTEKIQTFSREANKFSGAALFKQAETYAQSVKKIGGLTALTSGEQATLNRTLGDAVAKYKALGQEVPPHIAQLHLQTKLATGGTKELATATGGLGSSLSGLIPVMGAAAIIGFGKTLIDGASAVNDLSAKLGVSTDTVQRWQYAAEQTGASIDDVATASAKLGKAVVEDTPAAEKAFERLGLSVADLKGLQPDVLFDTVAEAVSQIKDPVERSTTAMELFGRSGTSLLPAMAEGWKKLGDQARDTGQIMSEDTIKAADDFGDALSTLMGAGKALITEFIAPFIPYLSAVANGLAWVAQKAGIVSKFFMDASKKEFRAMSDALEAVGLKTEALPPKLDELTAGGERIRQGFVPVVKDLALSGADLDATYKVLDGTLKDNNDTWKDAAEAQKKAEAAADTLNESQRKLLDTMRDAGIMTDAVVADSLAPLIEKLNLAAAVGDQQLRATLVKLQPEFAKLRAAIVAAGGDVTILDGVLQQFNDTAGYTAERLHNLEQAIPTRPLTDVVGKMQAYNVAAEQMKTATEVQTEAFHDLGMKSPAELQKIADAARANYQIVSTTAGVTKEQVKKAWDEMTAAQLAASGKVPSQWETEIKPRVLDAVNQISGTVSDSLAAMLTHASSFKDGFVNIWHSIRDELTSIFASILKLFVDSLLKGMLAAMAGQQGGFSGAFAQMMGGGGGPGGGMGGGILKAVGGLFGGGGAGVIGAVGGTGVEAGIPIFGAGAGLGTPVAGGAAGTWGGAGATAGVGTAVAGGALIGGAGFGLGALGQKFFGRGAGSAAFGGASGAGAGALIGTMVFPGVGTALGALIGGLSGVLGGVINFGPSKKERAARAGVDAFQKSAFAGLSDEQRKNADEAVRTGGWASAEAAGTLIAVSDAYRAIGKSGKDAERDVKAMWDAEKKGPEATQAAMQPMLAALEEYKKKQGETAAATTAALDTQKAKYTEAAEHIAAEMDGLTKELADLDKSEAPEAHMGSIEKKSRERIAARQAELEQQRADNEAQNKAAIDEITKSGTGAADAIAIALGGIKVPPITIPYRYSLEGEAPSGAPAPSSPPPVPQYAGGTPSLGFVDFGAGRLVELHGAEAVVPRSAAGAFAAAHGGAGGGSVSITIQAWDGSDVARVVNSPAFQTALARRLPYTLTDNLESSRTATRRALGVD